MLPVDILVSVPLPREERVPTTDDLTVEECCESGVLLCVCVCVCVCSIVQEPNLMSKYRSATNLCLVLIYAI